MAKSREANQIKKSEAVSCMVYVLARLGYPRYKIEEVTRELKKTFDLKCNSYTFETRLVTGRVERKNLLPTIDDQGEKKRNKSKEDSDSI